MRRRSLPVAALVLALALALSPAGAGAETETASNPCVGTVADPPEGVTLVTIQGARFAGGESLKTPGLLVAVGPRGRIVGVHNNSAHGRWWTYDVDPLSNGNLLVAATEPGATVVEEIDPATGEHVSVTRLGNVKDAHDVDIVGGSEYLLVDKGARRDRVLAYDRRTERIVWEWRFAGRYPESGGGPYPDDWTHVNDVDEIGDGRYLVSVRNFDQVIAVNRTTKAVEMRLGADDEHEILNEQHNPQYLDGEDSPAVLVADSENDRVVEYAREGGEWTRTWVLYGGGLDEPRDADRLPNGNTLVVDRHGQRTLEVAPNGTVLWEFYTPWQPYDAERYRFGDEPDGPTARELGATGRHELAGSARFDTAAIEACSDALNTFEGNGTLVPAGEVEAYLDAERPDYSDSTADPDSDPTGPGAGLGVIVALVVGVLALVAAFVYSNV